MPRRLVGHIDTVFGNRIREQRVRLGLSQSQLGKVVGVSFQQIQKYERGSNGASLLRLRVICQALGLDPIGVVCELLDAEQPTRKEKPRSIGPDRDMLELCKSYSAMPDTARPAFRRLARELARIQ